ncbi:MOSC and FAD-binding oxidoreductase domain-containing protein [Streptomyces thermodiastaticus]|uniref:MOSC and FAD-binding oxidoreductase domain-containing protein n=1 Tax=Streptomyces thermodiastaticus TaxID=44061 RepID=UPI001675ACA8|nr:MOSC and FAD-binding oxidoreductase domain-containing protein [Streptomyces thermodiastaticus]MCE7553292.1 MOSC domain-containing protein [Streptomyces thermodiastaticus]GHF95122.1 sulfurase [Streptomyces thermodiastaticus]
MATLLSVNVGMPKDVSWQGRTVRTGAWKAPVQGPRMVRRLNVEGDGQGDLAGHGGEIRAVLVYQLQSYQYWQKQLGRDDLTFGMFGENFTVDGLPDDDVCIGDRYRIGEAEFEVTQPRVTCYRVGMRLGEPAMASLLVAHHRPGFYLRVITEGHVQAGDAITLTRKGPEELSVADTDALLYLPDRDPAKLRKALNIPALSPGWQQSFRELAAAQQPTQEPGWPGERATTQQPREAPRWPGFKTMRVARIVPETPTVSSIYLKTTDGTPLPEARPGQYLSLRLPVADAAPAVRTYSLSSTSEEGTYRISVKHEPHGKVSSYIHTRLRPGDLLGVASPRGTFVLQEGTRPIALISAGIGATPVLAMLHHLAAREDPRPVWWIHTAHDRAHHAFADETHTLLRRLPNAHEHICYTSETAGPERSYITQGRPTASSLAVLGIPAGADAYLCGPPAFMDDIAGFLRDHGLSPERIHTEQFSALPAINPGITPTVAVRPHQPAGPRGTGPLITFARSGVTTPWSPAHASLLDLAEACDIPTRWSCRTGVCHTCITQLVAGDITYTTPPLELPEAGTILVCCSTPTTEVVLDL